MITVILGLALGILVANLSSLTEIVENEKDRHYIYNIDSQEEWNENEGIERPKKPGFFEGGKYAIEEYGNFRNESVVGYRTKPINASDEPLTLGNLTIEGYVADPASSLRLSVLDCEAPPKSTNVADVCYGDNRLYNTGFIREQGQVTFEKDLSNITADGYLHLFVEVYTRAPEPVSDNKSYIDSVKLTKAGWHKYIKYFDD